MTGGDYIGSPFSIPGRALAARRSWIGVVPGDPHGYGAFRNRRERML